MSTRLARTSTELVNAMYPGGLPADGANIASAFAITILTYAIDAEERSRKVSETPEPRLRADMMGEDEKDMRKIRTRFKKLPAPWNDGRLHRKALDRDATGRRVGLWLLVANIEIEVPLCQ